MEALIKREAGARRVVVFDHMTAAHPGRDAAPDSGHPRRRPPRPQRLHRVFGRQARARPDGRRGRGSAAGSTASRSSRYWRPIRLPVESWPLAICDSQTLDPKNMVVTERRYQDRVGPRPPRSPGARSTAGTGSRRYAARRGAGVQGVRPRRPTAARPAGPRYPPPSTTPPRHSTRASARASRSERWRLFSHALDPIPAKAGTSLWHDTRLKKPVETLEF